MVASLNMGDGIYYVYALFRPDTGIVFYIGMGKGSRAWSHIKRRFYSNYRKDRVVRQIVDQLGYNDFPVVIIREGLSRLKALDLETTLILAIGRRPHGPLANITDGGDGGTGPRSEETKQKMSAAHAGIPKPTHVLVALAAGYAAMDKTSPHWRAAQGARTRGKPKSLEHRAKISAALKGRRPTPQCIDAVRHSNVRRGRHNDPSIE